MATIRTAIQITDGMSPAFRSMNTAMNIVLSSFESLQRASSNAVDTSSIQTARQELARAESAFNQIEQEIRESNAAQERFNDSMRNGGSTASNLKGVLMKIGAVVGAYAGITKTLGLADELTQTKARLDLMNDGMQTTAELQNMIYASAQRSRGSYMGTADAVSKLGTQARDAFKSNAELVGFAEQINKTFVIAGTSAVGVESAMLQLTQAMASGRLQGEELNAILDNAQPIVQNIADYLEVPVGNIKKLASEGKISADVIKNAMFAAAEETNKKFESMPVTFGQVWDSIKNKAVKAFEPVLAKISDVTKGEDFNRLVDNVVGGIVTLALVSAKLFGILSAVASTISNNWSILSPIIYGVAGALTVYYGASLLAAGATAIATAAKFAAVPIYALLTGATMSATAAQWGLNAALYANPIVWVIIGVIALIAVFYAVIAIINKFAKTSYSATGIVMGAFFTVGAFISNLFFGLLQLLFGIIERKYNMFVAFANFLGNVFSDPVGAIINLFGDLADNVLGILQKIASAMDFIFGSTMGDTVKKWRGELQVMTETAVKKYGNGKYEDKVSKLDINGVLDKFGLKMDRFSYSDSYKKGYDFGEKLEDKFSLSSILDKASGSLDSFELGNSLDGIYNGVDDTALNTASMKDSMQASEEELKYLRDIAEQEVVNRFTTAEIKLEMTNNNNINSEMDLDGVVTYLEEKLYETINVAAEGGHK